jgi:hypothetical protein
VILFFAPSRFRAKLSRLRGEIDMRKVITVLLLTPLLGAWGVFGPTQFHVRIDGTPGIAFSGACELTNPGQSVSTRDAAGRVPLEFDVSAQILACVVQKDGDAGTLHVVITKKGWIRKSKPVAEGSTSVPHGTVEVAGR